MDSFTEIISKVVDARYGLQPVVQISRPDAAFGDVATNVALQLAKPLARPPREIAEELANDLRRQADLAEVQVAGPGFINIRFSAAYAADMLARQWSPQYGENTHGAGKTAVVEYPSPNMAKPYSVGHLRSGNQGWAAAQLLRASGWKVITDNHLGDYGAPFGVWATGFEQLSSHEALQKDGVYELGRVYIAMKKMLKDEQEQGGHTLADTVQQWLLRLEAGDEQAVAYSTTFNTISLEHIHSVMQRLGIATDYEYGEAFFAPQGKKAVQELLQSGVATQNDDGSVIISLEDQGIDVPLLVQKSNGAALYATTDLATILYREKHWHPDKVVYCVGAEQQFYFTQLAALAKKLGITTELYHLSFGTIDQRNADGSREKMSSRKGVVLMEALLDQAEAKARAVTEGRDVSADDIRRIALGAIKFSDFAADRRKNILFDWDTIFALTGFSGPYVQYAAVRVNKILRDNLAGEVPVVDYSYEPEKSIILKILEYPGVVFGAASELEPHKVATYLYELARDLNRYYEQTPVATPEVGDIEKAARLALLAKVSHVFRHGLGLLGIEVPSRM
ncbi:MAG: arginine--tRNA ligase [Candidatus Saccharimonas sp.]